MYSTVCVCVHSKQAHTSARAREGGRARDAKRAFVEEKLLLYSTWNSSLYDFVDQHRAHAYDGHSRLPCLGFLTLGGRDGRDGLAAAFGAEHTYE